MLRQSAVLINMISLSGIRPSQQRIALRSFPQHRNMVIGCVCAALWGAPESCSEDETHCPSRQKTWNFGLSYGRRSALQCPRS